MNWNRPVLGDASRTQPLLDRMRRKRMTSTGHAIYARRMTIVEPVFGQITLARGFRQFVLRGVENVRSEWALVRDIHNVLMHYRACKA